MRGEEKALRDLENLLLYYKEAVGRVIEEEKEPAGDEEEPPSPSGKCGEGNEQK